MHVISHKPFNEAIKCFPPYEGALIDLLNLLEKTEFSDPGEMKRYIPSLDNFKYRDKLWVINIAGNHLRLIAYIDFRLQNVLSNILLSTMNTTDSQPGTGAIKMRTHHTPAEDSANFGMLVKTFTHAVKDIPLCGPKADQEEYHNALKLIEFLVDRDDLENPLFELLCVRIREYENNAPEFQHFNQRLASTPCGVSLLRILMDQHGLKAADLAQELGSKSNVSNILNGRRALTVRHIKALSERFNLPAEAFIDK